MARGEKIDGLLRWVEREPWQEPFGAVIEQHLGEACSEADLTLQDLVDILGEDGFRMLWGSAFEDFLTRRLPDGRNVVDDYLKRRGWKESARTRAYMEALRDSVPSLYEVSDIVRGKGFAVRDLIRGGEPVAVEEHSGSRNIQQWDRIATRLVRVRGEPMFTGMLLRYSHKTADELTNMLEQLLKRALAEAAARGDEAGVAAVDALATDPDFRTEVLRRGAFVFSHFWLIETVEQLMQTGLPDLVNSDGDPFEMVTVTWPLAKGCRVASVARALDAAPMLTRVDDDTWNWLAAPAAEPKAAARKPEGALELTTTDEDGRSILGTIVLEDRLVTLLANAAPRAARGGSLVEGLLRGKLGEPSIERQSAADLLAEDKPADPEAEAQRLPLEEETEVVHEAMTRHYRKTLDQPVPALGNRSPRDLAKSPEGRDQVVAWLKDLENQTGLRGGQQMAEFDFAWLWAELGLADRRR